MKVFVAVAICKILYFIGRRVGRGSSLPGQVALRVCPGALKRLRLPERIVAVTGSNGKTSTVEYLAHALEASGLSVGWNREGSNQIEGVATLLLRIATFGGKVKRDALVLECDERYAKAIFEAVKPTVLVVTNLCRDQLTRNGHYEFISDCIRSAIEAAGAGVTLVLNADDPYVAALWDSQSEIRCFLFGIARQADEPAIRIGIARQTDEPPTRVGTYDDGAFCPVCKGRMTYGYRIAAHYGAFCCGACGHSRSKPDIEVIALDLSSGGITLAQNIAGQGSAKQEGITAALPSDIAAEPPPCFTTRLQLPGIAGAYNLAAAVAAAVVVGVGAETAALALDGYELEGGRTIRFSAGGRDGILLISKHENSLSYNQSMEWIVRQRRPCTVIVMVDSISRKYYTSETSWLWDVDFDILGGDCVRHVVLVGRYCNELMARFAMSAVEPGKITLVTDFSTLRASVEKCGAEALYAITCFADKAKLLTSFSAR